MQINVSNIIDMTSHTLITLLLNIVNLMPSKELQN
jgi:hypothetical protein